MYRMGEVDDSKSHDYLLSASLPYEQIFIEPFSDFKISIAKLFKYQEKQCMSLNHDTSNAKHKK